MTDEPPVTEWIEASFRELSVSDLLRERTQPMSAATRAMLEREIAARGVDADSSTSGSKRAAARARTVRFGARVLLVVAITSLLLGLAQSLQEASWAGDRHGDLAERRGSERVLFEGKRMRVSEARDELAARRYFSLKFGAGLAVIYAFLSLWSRSMPRTALSLALAIHVYETKVNLGAYDSLKLPLLVVPMLVAFGLIYALSRVWTMPPAVEEESYWEAWD